MTPMDFGGSPPLSYPKPALPNDGPTRNDPAPKNLMLKTNN